MKKIIPILILFLTFIGLAIFISLKNARTDTLVNRKWTLENKDVKNIEIYGTEQPIEVRVEKTDDAKTTVEIEGKVSKSSLKEIEKFKQNKDNLYIPISQKGFKLITSASGKDTLRITIRLGNNTIFQELSIDTWVGEVDVSVPSSFDGNYDVKLNNGAKLLEVPKTDRRSRSTIKIDAYSDVRIKKR